MKYKIYREVILDHKLNKETNLYEEVRTTRYGIERKGTIFGFWHTVGDWLMDSQGNRFCHDQRFDSPEQANSYLKCWHNESYPGQEVEVIYDPGVDDLMDY